MITSKSNKQRKLKQTTCPKCGAPIHSEICSYCGTKINNVEDLTSNISSEYPTLVCKVGEISFWNTVFPLIFMISFGFFGFIMPVIFLAMGAIDNEDKIMFLFFIPFAAVGIGAGVAVFRSLYGFVIIALRGEIINAVVYGYMDDTVSYNGNNGQVVKLLIDTPKGKRFIFYPLGKTNKPYRINSTICLKHFKNYFRILPENVWT